MKQKPSKSSDVLTSLHCEAVSQVRVEIQLYRYDAGLQEVTRHSDGREAEIEEAFVSVVGQVLDSARRRGWVHPFTVSVLAGPHGPLQRGLLPWEKHRLA